MVSNIFPFHLITSNGIRLSLSVSGISRITLGHSRKGRECKPGLARDLRDHSFDLHVGYAGLSAYAPLMRTQLNMKRQEFHYISCGSSYPNLLTGGGFYVCTRHMLILTVDAWHYSNGYFANLATITTWHVVGQPSGRFCWPSIQKLCRGAEFSKGVRRRSYPKVIKHPIICILY